MHIIPRFLKEETAAAAIEHGRFAAGIALAIIAAVKGGLGPNLDIRASSINSSLT